MPQTQDTIVAAVTEQLIIEGPEGMRIDDNRMDDYVRLWHSNLFRCANANKKRRGAREVEEHLTGVCRHRGGEVVVTLITFDDCEYDAFFSYVWADDEFYGNYVREFHRVLEQKAAHELRKIAKKHPELKSLQRTKPVFFIDDRDFSRNGALIPELKIAVEKSSLLFVFISDFYMESAYCAHEIRHFLEVSKERRRCSVKEALQRIFFVVTEADAVAHIDELATSLNLKDDERPIWEPMYDEIDKKPIPSHLPTADGINTPNNQYNDALIRIAKSFADRVKQIAEKPLVTPGPGMGDVPAAILRGGITIGATTADLDQACRTLANDLSGRGYTVRQIELDDLLANDADARFQANLTGSSIFVQPFSRAKTEKGIFKSIVGGHLQAQQDMLKDVPNGAVPILWWRVPADAAGQGTKIAQEDRAQHLSFFRHLEQGAVNDSISELVGRLTGAPQPSGCKRILLEANPADPGVGMELEKAIEDLWASHYMNHKMSLESLLWTEIHRQGDQYIKNYDGTLLVYGKNKDKPALQAQFDTLKNLEWKAKRRLGRAVAIVPDKDERDWPAVTQRSFVFKPAAQTADGAGAVRVCPPAAEQVILGLFKEICGS